MVVQEVGRTHYCLSNASQMTSKQLINNKQSAIDVDFGHFTVFLVFVVRLLTLKYLYWLFKSLFQSSHSCEQIFELPVNTFLSSQA